MTGVADVADERGDPALTTSAGYLAVLLWLLAAAVAAVAARWSGDEPL